MRKWRLPYYYIYLLVGTRIFSRPIKSCFWSSYISFFYLYFIFMTIAICLNFNGGIIRFFVSLLSFYQICLLFLCLYYKCWNFCQYYFVDIYTFFSLFSRFLWIEFEFSHYLLYDFKNYLVTVWCIIFKYGECLYLNLI